MINIQNFHSETVTPDYVYHPINAFHLLKRTSKWMPKIKLKIPNLKFNYNLRFLLDDYLHAHHGLAELHEYYELDPIEIANSEIKDLISGKVYKTNSQLDSSDLIQIAKEAKNSKYLDGYVNWLNAALTKAEEETKDSKYITKLRYKTLNLYVFVAEITIN